MKIKQFLRLLFACIPWQIGAIATAKLEAPVPIAGDVEAGPIWELAPAPPVPPRPDLIAMAAEWQEVEDRLTFLPTDIYAGS